MSEDKFDKLIDKATENKFIDYTANIRVAFIAQQIFDVRGVLDKEIKDISPADREILSEVYSQYSTSKKTKYISFILLLIVISSFCLSKGEIITFVLVISLTLLTTTRFIYLLQKINKIKRVLR